VNPAQKVLIAQKVEEDTTDAPAKASSEEEEVAASRSRRQVTDFANPSFPGRKRLRANHRNSGQTADRTSPFNN
jgi:hypothetical protein